MSSRYDISVTFRAQDLITGPMKRMTAGVNMAAASMERSIFRVNRSVNMLSTSLVSGTATARRYGTYGLLAVGGGLAFVTKQFSKLENAEASFTPILNGADNAKAAVGTLKDLAVKTPFTFEALATSTKTLLGFGAVTQKTIEPTLRMLGDVAGGNADQLRRISLVYGQVTANNKANSRDMLQFIDAGVPIKKLLAESMKIDVNTVTMMTEKGQILAKHVQDALVKATSKGGMFFETMELGSKTTTGLFNQLLNNITFAGAAVGEAINKPVKDVLNDLNKWTISVWDWANNVENTKPIADALAETISVITSLLSFVKDNWREIVKFSGAMLGLITALKILNAVMAITSIILNSTPFGRTVTAISLLIIGISALWAWWDDFSKAMPVFSEGLLIFGKVVGVITAAIVTLYGVIWTLSKAIYAAKFAFVALNFAMYLNPIGVIVAGVLLLIAAWAAVIYYMDDISAWFESSPQWMQTFAKAVFSVFNIMDNVIRPILRGFRMIGEYLGLLDGKVIDVKANVNTDMTATDNDPFAMSRPGGVGVGDVVPPQDRTAETISRTVSESKSNVEIGIRDETGRAEVKQTGSTPARLFMLQTGGM